MINGLEGERLTLGGLRAWPAQGSLVTVRLRPDSGRAAEHLRAEARDRAREDLAQQRRIGGNMSSHVEQNVSALLAAIEYLIDADGMS